ncbi:MAG: hypothetical protein RIE31_09465 [Alphaproteobacteria bacterium]
MLSPAKRNLWLLAILLAAMVGAWLVNRLTGIQGSAFLTGVTAWIIAGSVSLTVWSFRHFRARDSRAMCLLWSAVAVAVLVWTALAAGGGADA